MHFDHLRPLKNSAASLDVLRVLESFPFKGRRKLVDEK
jgi:hypothetical protein